MREFARVAEDSTLVRDLKSNAILSRDRAAFEKRKREKKDSEFKNTMMSMIEELQERVKSLEERLTKQDG
jgi:hypothetical protein